jgi:hypothetical protein
MSSSAIIEMYKLSGKVCCIKIETGPLFSNEKKNDKYS